ncbi:MAG: ATP-binding protein [Nanopusillaceae archaeon]
MDFQDLVNGLFPSLKGHIYKYIRQAVAYQLISIGKTPFFRDSIHILLLGEPGTGKSHMLKYVSMIPGNKYVNGENLTLAGLVGYISMYTMQQGVVSTVNGVLCIDEITKSSKTVRERMNELLEELSVTITKAGKTIKYDVNLAVLAATNPRHGVFKGKDIIEQIELPPTVIDRFDLIFVLKTQNIDKITNETYVFDNNELVKYLNEVRMINPSSSTVDLSKLNIGFPTSGVYLSDRRLMTVIRLAKAIAKSYKDNVIRDEYIQEAEKFFIKIVNRLFGYDIQDFD